MSITTLRDLECLGPHSSVLASLERYSPGALDILNHVESFYSSSNYYLVCTYTSNDADGVFLLFFFPDGDPNNVTCNDELAVGEITLHSRMRLRTSSFQKARNVARSMAMSRSAAQGQCSHPWPVRRHPASRCPACHLR